MATKQKLFLGGLPLERCFPVDSAIQRLNNWGVDSLQTADAFPVIAREATAGNASAVRRLGCGPIFLEFH